MLYFIAGRKNSRKTATAHKILGDCVKDGRQTMLIVPKQFTFESDKALLHALGPRLACEVDVLRNRLCNPAVGFKGSISKS